MKTEPKSTNKRRHNSCSNYVPFERTARRRTGEWHKMKHTNTTFSHLQPARVVGSSPNFAWW